MSPIKIGIVRYESVATAIANALGAEWMPDCRIGQQRITLTFKRLGASRWPEEQQIDTALRAAEIARSVLAADSRRAIRERADRAIEIVYEDASLVRGCAVAARWECVVPAPTSR
jgi:hypothetical protein